MLEVNLLDVATIFFLLTFTARGFFRGLVSEVAGIAAMILAFALARYFQDSAHSYVTGLFGGSEWTGVLTYFLIFLAVLLGCSLLMALLHNALNTSLSRWLSSFFGGLVGFAKGMLLTTAIFYVLLRYLPGIPVVRDAFVTPIFSSMARYLQGLLPNTLF